MHFSPVYATSFAHFMLLYLIVPVVSCEECNHEAPHYVFFSTHILLSFWNTLSLCFSLHVSIISQHHISASYLSIISSHPYTTTGRITILHFLILPFWERKWKTKDSGFNAEKHFLNLMYLISYECYFEYPSFICFISLFLFTFLYNFLIVCCNTGLIKINAVVLNVNYVFKFVYSISETRHSVFPVFQCYGSSSSGPHMGQHSISVQDAEHVQRSFLQSNKLLNTSKRGAFRPAHRVWCAYASQDGAPSSWYTPINAACYCRWQVKVVWNHDTMWKAGNGQPFI